MTHHYQWPNNALIYTHNTDFNGRPWVDKGNFQLERVIPQW